MTCLEAPGPVSPGVPRCPKALYGRVVIVCCRHRSKSTVGLEQRVKRFPLEQFVSLNLIVAIHPLVSQTKSSHQHDRATPSHTWLLSLRM